MILDFLFQRFLNQTLQQVSQPTLLLKQPLEPCYNVCFNFLGHLRVSPCWFCFGEQQPSLELVDDLYPVLDLFTETFLHDPRTIFDKRWLETTTPSAPSKERGHFL